MRHIITVFATLTLTLVAGQSLAQSYTYDEFGRVKSVTTGAMVTNYCYDKADNRYADTTASGGSSCPASNHAPTCTSPTIVLFGLPTYGTTTVSVQANQILALCSDADGDTMTVTSPSPLPKSQTLAVGVTSVSFPFTVSDGHGGSASGSVTYHRP